ncbi:hypothetical protein [Cupriavidus alkaliphilus]|uniref:hypothetical protein n=1 Tax=Cupriavidus alkaliphilus TaxID=942866 RepID=UPI00339D7250
MHLEFDRNGKASVNHWIVIDDFGTEHDAVHETGIFGGYGDAVARTRREFLDTALRDPDYSRAFWGNPKYHRALETVSFASPIGMSIELEIRIDFELHPFWDERTWEPLWTRAEGATIKILHAGANEWEWQPASTVLTRVALEAFCWAYLDLKKAREAEEARARREACHG